MNREKSKARYFDYPLLVIMIFLICFGLIMVYSTSYYSGMKLKTPNPEFYLNKQIKSTAVGLFIFIICIFFDYKYYAKLAVPIYIISIFCVFALKTPLGITRNGATRWLGYRGLSFQPAELCKISVMIIMARYIAMAGKNINKLKTMIIAVAITAFPAGLLYIISHNLSSAIIVFGIGAVMYLVATKNNWPVILGAVVLIVGIPLFMYYITHYVDPATAVNVVDEEEMSFRFKRILAWRHPENYSDDTSYQTLQSLYALASGGFFGKGLGRSIQKLGFIPEAQNDMIFAVVCEELGLFGGICLILLFVLLIFRLVMIALYARDLFSSILVVGIAAHIAIQVILNIAVVTNTIPNTGISLPFISYGGTSVLFLMAEMGIALNVSKSINRRD